MADYKRRIYEILEEGKPGDRLSGLFDLFLILLVVLNVTAVILESVKSIYLPYKTAFFLFEVVSVIIFSVEYLLRVWVCTCDPRYRHALRGRLQYMRSPMALVDLLAILPFYLYALGIDMRVVRVFRLFRVFRLAKLVRYSRATRALIQVLRDKKAEIGVTVFIMLALLIVSSTLMYYVENSAQPNQFSSIPAAMWWGIATLTTVGYGDIAPVTALGKLLATLIAILGIGMFALPAGIFGSAFIDMLSEKDDTPVAQCPHCGKDIATPRAED